MEPHIAHQMTQHGGNFPVGLAARKGLRRATSLRPKRVPKTKKKVASKNPKRKGKLLQHGPNMDPT